MGVPDPSAGTERRAAQPDHGHASIVKRDHGFISVGSVVSEGNPFTSELVANTGGVRFTFSFSEDIDVSVEVTRAYTTRFSEIYSTELGPGGTGPPLMFKAFSSCFVRPDHLAVNETASDDSVPSLRTLVIPGSRKRRRKGAQRVVTVAGHLGQRRCASRPRARAAVRRGGPASGQASRPRPVVPRDRRRRQVRAGDAPGRGPPR